MVAEKLEIPTRELSSIPKAPPLGGTVGGTIAISGGLADPERTLAVDGKLGWHGFPTAVGGTGDVAIAVAGNGAALTANVTDGPIAIAATVKRAGDHIDVTAHATGDTPLLPLLPAAVGPKLEAIKTAGGEPELGTLHLDMSATVALLKTATGIAVDRADISGPLAIHGAAFKLPHADRRWHDITLEANGDPHGVRLTKLELHESDAQNPDRKLSATGLFELDRQLKPRRAELEARHVRLAAADRPRARRPAAQRRADGGDGPRGHRAGGPISADGRDRRDAAFARAQVARPPRALAPARDRPDLRRHAVQRARQAAGTAAARAQAELAADQRPRAHPRADPRDQGAVRHHREGRADRDHRRDRASRRAAWSTCSAA